MGAEALSDEAAMAQAMTGDRAAFRLLVDRHYALALRIAGRISVNRADAEEVVQEAFLKMWRLADRFDPERGKLTAWLARMVTNQALDRRRALKPVSTLEEAYDLADAGDTPEDSATRREMSGQVQMALATLPPRQRAALALFYGEGYSMAEVAGAMEMGVKAVESLLSRGRAGLKQALMPLRQEGAL